MGDAVAVVTGAGRGIGRQIAATLAGHGMRLVLAARSVAALEGTASRIRDDGGEALVIPTDITDAAQVEALSARATEAFGRVDVLVCNSGVAGPTSPLWEVDPDEWAATMAVNVTGVYLCCRAFLPTMIERGAGSIVVVGSMTGKRPLANRTPYAASKTALIGFVRNLAHEVGPHGIRVNLVSPGGVEGDRIDAVIERQAAAQQITVAQARQQFSAPSALGRLVLASEVAEAVSFLASERGSAITGEDLNVSAGVVME